MFAIDDNNISSSLLTIIIKIIIIYFIQIRHTEDFPPTGTPASLYKLVYGLDVICRRVGTSNLFDLYVDLHLIVCAQYYVS